MARISTPIRSDALAIIGLAGEVWSMCRDCLALTAARAPHPHCLTHIADHHCHFLSTCIGHRNYAIFVTFIAYETLADAYMMRAIISLLSARPADYFVKDYLLLVVIVVNAVTVMLLSLLSLTHIYLSLTNQTTYELFGYRIWYLPPAAGDRPFDSGHPLTNLRSAFCWRSPLRHVMYTDCDVGPRASADRLVRTRRPSIWSNKYYNCIG